MKFFESYFSDVEFNGAEEVKVLCPFHSDTSPSASINTVKEVFHCWVCDVGHNEAQFLSKVNNISLTEANKLLSKMSNSFDNWEIIERAELWANNDMIEAIKNELKLSNDVIEEVKLGLMKDDLGRPYLGIPVYYNGMLVDTRRYNLFRYDNVPKMMASSDAQMGYTIPYDVWKDDRSVTYIFEGEKDMLIARELGLNAITLTGGAGARPNEYVLNEFSDRDVVICYDNDKAGVEGANKLYLELKDLVKSIKYINIGDVVEEDKEDFFDFIVKYEKDVFDFYDLEEYEFKDVESKIKLTCITTALENDVIRKVINSEITVSAEFADSYAVPVAVEAEKMDEPGRNDKLFKGETRDWYLENFNVHQALPLIETSAKKHEVNNHLKSFMGIDSTEKNVKITISAYQTVYKIRVMDKDAELKPIALDLYAFEQMEVGGQYRITYKIYPHPTKHQKLVGIATNVVSLSEQENFKPNKTKLDTFRNGKSVEENVQILFESAKHHIAKHLDKDLWLMSDLVFNSVLEFDYGDRIRGALDVFILGDTQVGKSETTSKLTELYSFGHFLSLKTSTTVGLIGGSNKVEGTWMNTIGSIPRQHKKLVVLEEFSGARRDFIKTMTDIRSSGRLRLARASGELNVPCRLRMITISNPLNDKEGNPRYLSYFPNGVIPIMELIKSPEDVARYDGFLLVEKPETRFNPFALKLIGEPIPKDNYNHKINWVASRKAENVRFEEDTESYIWEKAQELNKIFECNFPLFGTTSALKLARFSVALASLIVSTDNYEDIIVTKEIVDYVVAYLKRVYDNKTFKLREYKEQFDSYRDLEEKDLISFQKLYNRNYAMLDFLSHQVNTSRGNLMAVSGLDSSRFSTVFNQLVQLKVIRLVGDNIYPTPKFRKAIGKVDKNSKQGAGRIVGRSELDGS